MSKPSPIEHVKEWLSKYGLKWNDSIERALIDIGVECVEDLKYLQKTEWDDLFQFASGIIRRRANQVYDEYLRGDPDQKKCSVELGLKQLSALSDEPKEMCATISKPGIIRAGQGNKSLLDAGFTRKVTKTVDQKQTERERKRKAAELEAEVMGDSDSDHDLDIAHEDTDTAEDNAADIETPILPALGPSDWRAARCALSQELFDPANNDEKLKWDIDLLPVSMQPNKNCNDLEDVDGHYSIIECSKISSDYDVKESFNEKWRANKRKVLKFHPDKSTADGQKYAKAKSVRDKLQAVKEVLCHKDADGCYRNRVSYDQKGEKLRQTMREVSE